METDFDEETPLSSSSSTTTASKPHTFHFDSSLPLPKSSSSSSSTRRISRSIYTVLIKAKINILLPFGPLAIFLHYFTAKHVWVFFFALLGIAPLAERLGYATEYVSILTPLSLYYHYYHYLSILSSLLQTTCLLHRINRFLYLLTFFSFLSLRTALHQLLLLCAVGGLLNATFGNATEMIISIYALKSDMIRVVQQSLLGSILSNMLLVLGCAFFTGGIVHYQKLQVFNKVRYLYHSFYSMFF